MSYKDIREAIEEAIEEALHDVYSMDMNVNENTVIKQAQKRLDDGKGDLIDQRILKYFKEIKEIGDEDED